MKRIIPPLFFLLSISINLFSQAPGCPSLEVGPAPTFSTSDTVLCDPSNLTLTAHVFHVGYTNTYTVSSIPYNPPYPFTAGTPIALTQDDYFGPVVNLPFDFCFFGQSYNQLVVGANGIISFDLSTANQSCPWSFSASLPSTSLFKNAIFGAYHDIDPSVCGNFRYGVLGSYPCRTFVMNFDQVCHFSCNSIKSTLQVVLYEGTNVIEVHILNKPTCSSWNSGNCVIGIQNAAGTVAFVPPGRNTGPWSTTNESWRFTPNGTPTYNVAWFENGAPIGNSLQVNRFVDHAQEYVCIVTYNTCNGNQMIFRDTVRVSLFDQPIGISTNDSVLCQGETTTLTSSPADAYQWSNNETTQSVDITPAASGYYSVTGTFNGICHRDDSIYIKVNPNPVLDITATKNGVCQGDSSVLTVTGAQDYVWGTTETTPSITVKPTATTTYSVTGTSVDGCTGTSDHQVLLYENPAITMHASSVEGCTPLKVKFTPAVTPNAASYNWNFSNGQTSVDAMPDIVFDPKGTYDVKLDVLSNDGCPGSVQLSSYISVYPLPTAAFTTSTDLVYTDQPTITFTDNSTLASTWFWDFGDNSTVNNYSTEQNPSHDYKHEGVFYVRLTVTTDHGCRDSVYHIVEAQNNIAFYLPNAFSPYNKDGLNDIWKPNGIGLFDSAENFSLNIFNRWGQLVFSSNDFNCGWDGKVNGDLVAPDIYNFVIKVKFADGLWQKYQGNITLVN